MATRDTNGPVGSSPESGLGASRLGSTGSTSGGSVSGGSTGGTTAGSVRDTMSSTTDQVRREAETEGNRLIGAARSRARSA